MMKMVTTYDYDNVMLVPKECVVETRGKVDVSARLGKRTFRIPLMAANMPCIVDESVAIDLAERDYFYVMHRFNVDTVSFVKKMHSLNLYASISVGIREESYEVLNKLRQENLVPEYITIDISHGHNKNVKNLIFHIRSLFGYDTFVIAGNVGTPEALKDLEEWGADAVKVGIGPGHVCTTSPRTGFGTRGWQLCAVAECAKVANKVVIADGGVSKSGDIAKAIHFGAHWVMSGYLFSGHMETPGQVINQDGVGYKSYYGNASTVVKGENRRVEGKQTLVPCTTSLFDKLREVEEDLQSSVSFSGGTKLSDLRYVEHVFINLPYV